MVTVANSLLTPKAVRHRAQQFHTLAHDDQLSNFVLREEFLPKVGEHVIRLLNARFPNRKVPFHARWRHFEVAGTDRAARLLEGIEDRIEKVRARFDLAITSVLLDAGAGDKWSYRDATGQQFIRSEGLAIASLDMFGAGFFSSRGNPLQADANRLTKLREKDLATAFQASRDNPLVGLAGRAALLSALGNRILEAPDFFPGDTPRPGNLFDYLQTKIDGKGLPAREILIALLHALGPIWPDRLSIDGTPLGDTWCHAQASGGELADGYIPFHKLSQWLAYSLIEPLQEAGIIVTGVNELTGLAEYRNGGLFVDYGVIQPRHSDILTDVHAPGSDVIIEWRALTVALLDAVADQVRDKLGLDAESLPLASVLEAGTWAAGREIAQAKRTNAAPPIAVSADGTVF
jgi:uncharacterized protein DUF1688